MASNQQNIKTALPWWTWVVPILVVHFTGHLSLLFKYDQGVSTLYLPTAFAIVMVNWWGVARVVPALFIVATLNTYYWGIMQWWLWPILSTPEVVAVSLSYYLFRIVFKGKYWLPSTREFLFFTLVAIIVPMLIELLLLQFTLIYFGEQSLSAFGENFLRNWLGEFTANFGIATPLLFLLTPLLMRKGWLLHSPDKPLPFSFSPSRTKVIELVIIYASLLLLSFTIPFETYWFVYGLVSLYVAIRFGFGDVLLCNLYIFLITFLAPVFFPTLWDLNITLESELYIIFLGNLLLSLFAAITGRVISDLRLAEETLNKQKAELEAANLELDRFVYSASHDLSAPLKSVMGLIAISKIDPSPDASKTYLHEIETSVKKLDAFIGDILDYSRNKRSGINPEKINLKDLFDEILTNVKYIDGFSDLVIERKGIEQCIVNQDKTRLKIILNNLISNAVKFKKPQSIEAGWIMITCEKKNGLTQIHIEDNGEGIKADVSKKIFDMFYRASEKTKGSGLGLYIALESAQKIGGTIRLKSEYGKGSCFTVEFPEL